MTKRTGIAAGIAMVVALLGAVLLVVTSKDAARAPGVSFPGDRPLAPTANPRPVRGKAGPSLIVDPADENHVVELHQELVTAECEVNVSFDRGRTWAGGTLQAPAGYPAPGPCSVTRPAIANVGQQSAAFGSGRNVYVSWAASSRPASHGNSVLVSRSTDGGATFGPAVEVPGMAGGIAPEPDFARPELVVDRRTPTTDRIYVTARNARESQAIVVRSDDGGTSWSRPLEVSTTGFDRSPPPTFEGRVGAVAAAGDAYTSAVALTQPVLGPAPPGGGERPLHLGWAAAGARCPPACEGPGETGSDGYLVVATSADGGQTWTRTRAVNLRGYVGDGGFAFGNSSFPRLAGGPDGGLYVVFNQPPATPPSANCGTGPFPAGAPGASTRPCPTYRDEGAFRAADHTLSFDADVWFLRSTDGGVTWGDLRQVNDPKRPGLAVPEVTQTRHPQIGVATDGRIDIVWEDRRHWYLSPAVRQATATPVFRCVHTHAACEEARLGDTYHASSTDGGLTFTPNRRLNDRSHNNDVGFDHRVSAYRDYGPVTAALGGGRLLVADMDSRLGTPVTNTLDVFLREVTLGPQAAPLAVDHLATGDAASLTVALSRRAFPGGAEAVLAGEGVARPATSVVIVNEADAPAALMGGVLARAGLGSVLAGAATGLPDVVRDELDRLDPVKAYVIGDSRKLGPQVQVDIGAAGVAPDQITRISAVTPADVAAAVARVLDGRTPAEKAGAVPVPAFDAAVVVDLGSPSAAAAAALAASRRLPILHADAESVPAATASALADLGIRRTLVVGGTIGPAVEAALPGPVRLEGADPYAVSRSVLEESRARGLPTNIVYLADGTAPMHAALLGGAVARLGGLLLLVRGAGPGRAEALLGELGLRSGVDRLVISALT